MESRNAPHPHLQALLSSSHLSSVTTRQSASAPSGVERVHLIGVFNPAVHFGRFERLCNLLPTLNAHPLPSGAVRPCATPSGPRRPHPRPAAHVPASNSPRSGCSPGAHHHRRGSIGFLPSGHCHRFRRTRDERNRFLPVEQGGRADALRGGNDDDDDGHEDIDAQDPEVVQDEDQNHGAGETTEALIHEVLPAGACCPEAA